MERDGVLLAVYREDGAEARAEVVLQCVLRRDAFGERDEFDELRCRVARASTGYTLGIRRWCGGL